MSCTFPIESLEALVHGELDAERAAKVEQHVVECAHCRDEREWLVAEQAAFAARTDAGADCADLWAGIEERLDRAKPVAAPAKQPGKLIWFASGFAVAAAAAAALLLWATPARQTAHAPEQVRAREPSVTPVALRRADAGMSAEAAALADLEQAERQYLAALERLKAAYRQRYQHQAPALVQAYERAMNSNLERLRAARATAGNDVSGRIRVLDAYSTYVHTLQAAEGTDI